MRSPRLRCQARPYRKRCELGESQPSGSGVEQNADFFYLGDFDQKGRPHFEKPRFSFQVFLSGLNCENSRKLSSGWRFKCEKLERGDFCEIGTSVMLMHTCVSSLCSRLTHVMSRQFHLIMCF